MSSEIVADSAKDTPVAPIASETPQTDSTSAVAKTLFDAETKQTPVAEKPEAPKEEPKSTETKSADPLKVEKVVPEKYDLKLPEDTKLKASDLEKIASIAKERGFTQEQAQTLVDAKHEALSEYVQEQQKEINQKARVEWVNEAKNDKEIGGDGFNKNVEMAKNVVQRFGTDLFKKALDETGLGNHPELLRVFARIGKAMEPHDLIKPGAQANPAQRRSMESVLYGESGK